MVKIYFGGKHGHVDRERDKRARKEERERMRQTRRQENQQHPLNILFYGKYDWYSTLKEKLALPDTISNMDFGDIPDIDPIDVIVIDCFGEEDNSSAQILLELIEGEAKRPKICLSYEKITDTTNLSQYQSDKFHYNDISGLKNYFNNIRQSRSMKRK